MNIIEKDIVNNKIFPYVVNISGYHAEVFEIELSNTIWISIDDPEVKEEINNLNLRSLPKLNINFYDLIEDVITDETRFYAPKIEDAKMIVDFILQHPNKNVLVNCVAGSSRSGAVAKFCEESLNYHWIPFSKKLSDPNFTLYQLLNLYYQTTK